MDRSRRNLSTWTALAALVLALAGTAWAATERQSSDSQSAYQSGGDFTPSGNIIGYQPIPNSALVTGQSAAASHQGSGQPGSQLPIGYVTGVVGEGLYTLGRDDILHVDVRNQTEFTGDFIVGFDGRIQYNYLGDIPVAGMTKYEVQQILEKLLQKYIRVPVVTVSIVGYNSKVVYVIGEVGRPGKYIMRGDSIKLREAILAAGLPTRHAALGRTHIIKPDLNDPRVRKVNLKKILYKGKLQDDVSLYPGEIIVLPSTVLSSINDFLSQLLNPITRAAAAAAVGVGL